MTSSDDEELVNVDRSPSGPTSPASPSYSPPHHQPVSTTAAASTQSPILAPYDSALRDHHAHAQRYSNTNPGRDPNHDSNPNLNNPRLKQSRLELSPHHLDRGDLGYPLSNSYPSPNPNSSPNCAPNLNPSSNSRLKQSRTESDIHHSDRGNPVHINYPIYPNPNPNSSPSCAPNVNPSHSVALSDIRHNFRPAMFAHSPFGGATATMTSSFSGT